MVGSHYLILNTEEVLFVEADRQVCHLHLTNGNRMIAARHLGYYKSNLIQDYCFVELSKSLLVNAIHLQKYSPRERIIQLSSGKTLPVAKTRQEALNRIFRQLHDGWRQDSEAESLTN